MLKLLWQVIASHSNVHRKLITCNVGTGLIVPLMNWIWRAMTYMPSNLAWGEGMYCSALKLPCHSDFEYWYLNTDPHI